MNMAPSEKSAGALDEHTISTLFTQYEQVKLFDSHRSKFIEDLLTRLHSVSEHLLDERAAFGIERNWAEQTFQQLQHDSSHLKKCRDSDPFVLVIIDGADLIFRNSFLRDGDTGGRRCAAQLHQAINEYVFATVDDLPSETKVCLRMYVDIEDLVGLSVENRIVDTASKIRSFARGFIQDKVLFDIVNVYSQGRETIIDKVEAQLMQHLYDFHCRHIILGCSDEGIYARVLRKVAQDESLHHNITILSGVPLNPEFSELPFQCTRIPEIFRNTRVDVHRVVDHIPEIELMSVNRLPSVIGTPLGVLTPPLSTPTLSVRSESRQEKAFPNSNTLEKVSRTNSVASTATSGVENVAPRPTTWATISKASAALPIYTVSNKLISKDKEAPLAGIRRNKQGQRLDPTPPEYKRDEVNRVKKLKLCNAYYLRGDCPHKDSNCTHQHAYKCTKSEIETLKLVARMSCCIHDSACDDEKCIYGHNCPFPEAKEGSMRGKGCLNGDNCRFPPHMHGMDMIPARYAKAT